MRNEFTNSVVFKGWVIGLVKCNGSSKTHLGRYPHINTETKSKCNVCSDDMKLVGKVLP